MVQEKNKLIIKPLFLLLDLTGIVLSYFLSFYLKFYFFYNNDYLSLFYQDYLIILIVSLCVWSLLSFSLNLQHVPRRRNKTLFLGQHQIKNYYFYPQIIQLLCFLLFIVFMNIDNISRLFILIFFQPRKGAPFGAIPGEYKGGVV